MGQLPLLSAAAPLLAVLLLLFLLCQIAAHAAAAACASRPAPAGAVSAGGQRLHHLHRPAWESMHAPVAACRGSGGGEEGEEEALEVELPRLHSLDHEGPLHDSAAAAPSPNSPFWLAEGAAPGRGGSDRERLLNGALASDAS